MASRPSDYAHAAWSLGYAEEGIFPVPATALAAHHWAAEAADASPLPDLVAVVTEAGRKTGRRAGLMAQRRRVEDDHREALAGVLAAVVARVDVNAVCAAAAALAALQASLRATPVQRRRAVAGAVKADLSKSLTAEDRNAWHATNAAGYIAASAQGTAEADASDGSGPPKPSDVEAGRDVAIAAVPSAAAQLVAATWTDEQLSALAMGVAMAVGDGKELSVATKAATDGLSDGSWAMKVYGDQLHRQMMGALVANTAAMNAAAAFYFVTEDDARVCPVCVGLADGPDGAGSPYPADSAPQPPEHALCRCYLEVAGVSVSAI